MAPRSRRSPWPLAVALALGLALSPAADASARKFQMSGNWVIRNGTVFIPWDFAAPQGTPAVNVSMGNLTGALGFGNGPIPGLGGVTATGSAPATLRVPAHRFVQDAMAAVPFSGVAVVQLTTNFGVDAPYAPATLAKSGGPGSFTWCPGDALCLDGPGTMLASDPPQGIGGRNGRVIYRAGANRFGGVMQIGLRRGGVLSRRFQPGAAVPVWVEHGTWGGAGSTLRAGPVGGLGAADDPEQRIDQPPQDFVTQPLTFMAGQLIAQPGPKLTTMLGLSNTMAGPILYVNPGVYNQPGSYGRTNNPFTGYGFAHTTGTVIVQQTAGGSRDDFFSVMGYDKRTALGAGAIQTVAGGLFLQTRPAWIGDNVQASMHRVRMTLGAPIPSLSPAGVAAAAALVLVAAGYALGRRL